MPDKDVFGISSDNVDIDGGLSFVDTKAHAEYARRILSMSKEELKAHNHRLEAELQYLRDNDLGNPAGHMLCSSGYRKT